MPHGPTLINITKRVLRYILPPLGALFIAQDYLGSHPKTNLPLWGVTLAIWLFYEPVARSLAGMQREKLLEDWQTQAHTKGSSSGLGYDD